MSEKSARFIKDHKAALEPQVIAWRRSFHSCPETGTNELETSRRIARALDEMGIEYRRVEGLRPAGARGERDSFIGTGLIATIRGTAPGSYDQYGTPARRVALRADIDGLAVKEETGLSFASENEGSMHACGHDAHIAMMLGAAKLLSQMTDYLKGEVRIIFQPAEEISIGARDMIAAGALEGVDAIYGAHIWSEVEAGKVSIQPGPRMASTDWFRVDITGESAHGSMPHKGTDAIVIGAEMVTSMQLLVSREASPFDPVVVTVGEFHGGTARNIMAGSAYFTGTVRTWNPKTRATLTDQFERIVGKVAHAFNATIDFKYEAGNPGLLNDPECTEVARAAAVDVLGKDALASYHGTMAGEDFSEYLQHVPGVFVFVGTRNEEKGLTHPQHSSHFDIDESVLVGGSMLAAQWAARELT